jgi:hypothetical protein
MKCPEDPEKLCGQPIGQYHCPYCGCMQVACIPHMCDPDLCLLEGCDCLPEGVTKSPNLIETEALEVLDRSSE